MAKIKYTTQMSNTKLSDFSSIHSQKPGPKSQGETEKNMETTSISWDEASGSYFKLEEEKRKEVVIKNWKLQRVPNRFKKKDTDPEQVVEFSADVIEVDGVEVELPWTSTSRRLIAELRKVLEDKDPEQEARFSVKQKGKAFDTTYDVEQL